MVTIQNYVENYPLKHLEGKVFLDVQGKPYIVKKIIIGNQIHVQSEPILSNLFYNTKELNTYTLDEHLTDFEVSKQEVEELSRLEKQLKYLKEESIRLNVHKRDEKMNLIKKDNSHFVSLSELEQAQIESYFNQSSPSQP